MHIRESCNMLITKYKDFELHRPTSGGKAGKDRNITSTIQVRRNGVIVKEVRYHCLKDEGYSLAIEKACKWCDGQAILTRQKR